MAKLVMPKNSADVKEIMAVFKIYVEAGGWLDNDTYKIRLKKLIGDGQYESSYTKKSQMTSYFGFTTWEDITNVRSRRCITRSGIKFYNAYLKNDKNSITETIVEALERVTFGRNNYGCPDSDSDVEPPCVFIRACLELGYLTYPEFAFLLWKMEDEGGNYTDICREIKNKRDDGTDVVVGEAGSKYKDCKPILMLVRWGFLVEDTTDGVQNKHVFVASDVLAKYETRLRNLKIYNVDKKIDIASAEESVDNEPAFRDWMAQQKKDNGEPYASTTIDQECSRLKNAKGKDSIKDIIPCENLFEIDDVESIDNVRKKLENKIAGDESAKSETDGLPNALNLYYQFLVQKNKKVYFKSDYSSDKFRNRIIFGAPGTGKSNTLNKGKDAELSKQGGEFERVTFHPDYSYAQFVGCYKPKMNGGKIEYSFVPGPFTRVLREALKNCMSVKAGTGTAKPYLLLIEELNRAKTAAVFGDVFQLLDRGDDGVSEYDIQTSEDLRKYLAQELGVSEDAVASIKIPDNMFIWATMNSADQGVFPLDTAFKRRWNFEYIDINSNEDNCDFEIKFKDKNEKVQWNKLRKAINNVLSNEPVRAHEDKLLGPYFIKDQKDDDRNTNMFCDKVLMYLFDDVGRTRRKDIFDEKCTYTNGDKSVALNINRLSSIIAGFKAAGINIFVKGIRDKYLE